MKLVKESLNMKHTKSEDLYNANKEHYKDMILHTMEHFGLSKDVAVIMITKSIERASSELPNH